MQWLSSFLCMWSCCRMPYSLMSGSQREKKKTLKGKRKCWLFKFLRSYFSWRSRDLQHWVVWKNDCIPVSAPPLSVNISDQNTDPIYLKDRVHIVQTGSHRLCESCSREMHSCLPQGCRWGCPKGERAVKPVISLPSKKWVLKIGFLKVQNW